MDRLLNILKTIRPHEDYESSNDFLLNEQLDSFDIMMLFTELENKFSIKIQSDDIAPNNLRNLQTIKRMLERYGVIDTSENSGLQSLASSEIPGKTRPQSTTTFTRPIEDTKRQIIKTLKVAGIQEGDITVVQSDASAVMELGEFNLWDDALELLTECFLEVLGPSGTLIVPTFNWDFCIGTIFDYEKTPSQLGMFSNYILSHQDSVRSLNPILSFAAIGPHADLLFQNLPNSCYGSGSVYQKLHSLNAKLLFFNIYLRQANFVHYIEQEYGVDYRFTKQFSGQIRQSGQQWEDTYDLYVRKDMHRISTDLSQFERRMYDLEKASEVAIADKYPVVTATTDDVYNVVRNMLEQDPHCLYTTEPASEVMSNRKRVHSWNKKLTSHKL